MSKLWEVAKRIRQGKRPPDIATELDIALSTTLSYARRAVGEGYIRRSDVFFSFASGERDKYESELRDFAAPGAALADMYEDIFQIETALHSRIREVLTEVHGADEQGWWRSGIPEEVRIKCCERRERDPERPCEAFGYTDLLDLAKILEANWSEFRDDLKEPYRSNRKTLTSALSRLNLIRNRVMHPVRGRIPSEEDFHFVRGLASDLGVPDPRALE